MDHLRPPGRAGRLVAHHGMALIPDEGAWFALNYVSADQIPASALSPRYAGTGPRPLGNAIYALVTRRDFSALHRLRTDETWHFHEGDVAELLLLHPDGRVETVAFGADTLAGQRAQVTVPAGTWMGARPARDAEDAYSFFGCTLAPGFDYADYEPGYRDELRAAYPAAAELVDALTREPFARRPAGAVSTVPALVPSVTRPAAVSRVISAAEAEAAVLAPAPGLRLRELAGRAARHRTAELSVTCFTLAPGVGTGTSRYLGADEFFYVLSGAGVAELGARREEVSAGSLVIVSRGEPHALVAGPGGLEFLALIAPAFNPSHYAPEPAPPPGA